MSIKKFNDGQFLFREGEKTGDIFIINKGIIEVYRGEIIPSNQRLYLMTGALGIMDALNEGGQKYFYTARVKTYAEAFIVKAEEIKRSLQGGNPAQVDYIVKLILNEAHTIRYQLDKNIESQEFSGENYMNALEATLKEQIKEAEEAEKDYSELLEFLKNLGIKVKVK